MPRLPFLDHALSRRFRARLAAVIAPATPASPLSTEGGEWRLVRTSFKLTPTGNESAGYWVRIKP